VDGEDIIGLSLFIDNLGDGSVTDFGQTAEVSKTSAVSPLKIGRHPGRLG
jgi:hypothetical protein